MGPRSSSRPPAYDPPDRPFYAAVTIVPLMHKTVSGLRDQIEALGGFVDYDATPKSEEEKDRMKRELIAAGAALPFSISNINIVDGMQIQYYGKSPHDLKRFMDRLQEVVPNDCYSRVYFSVHENITPSDALLAQLDTHRQRQGTTQYDMHLRQGGTDLLPGHEGAPSRFLLRMFPNHLETCVTLAKEQKESPSHLLIGSCTLDYYQQGSHPYDDVTGHQMASLLNKIHTHLMQAQRGSAKGR